MENKFPKETFYPCSDLDLAAQLQCEWCADVHYSIIPELERAKSFEMPAIIAKIRANQQPGEKLMGYDDDDAHRVIFFFERTDKLRKHLDAIQMGLAFPRGVQYLDHRNRLLNIVKSRQRETEAKDGRRD